MTHAQPQKKSFFNMNVDLMHGPIFKKACCCSCCPF